jgi:hypothetical protein
MLLTAADQPLYFPSVALTGAALDMAIALVQGLVEAHIGRSLERQQYHEMKRLNESFDSCQLLYTPIALLPIPVIEGRFGGGLNRFSRKVPVGEWRSLSAAEYAIDRSGRFELKGGGLSYPITQIRVSYFSGVDAAVDSPELRRLKAALGAALVYSQSDLFSGIITRSVDKEYSVSYGGRSGSKADGAGMLPASYLSPFKRYKPGSYQPIWDDEEPLDPMANSAEIDTPCAAGQPVYVKNNGHLGLAQANAIATVQVVGLTKTSAIAATSVEYDPDGVLELSNWLAIAGTVLLTPGAVYYLSADFEGNLTTAPSEAVGGFVVRVGTALSPTRLSIEIEPPIAL